MSPLPLQPLLLELTRYDPPTVCQKLVSTFEQQFFGASGSDSLNYCVGDCADPNLVEST